VSKNAIVSLNCYQLTHTPANFNIELKKRNKMNKLIRTLIAGWGAKKLGGGCIGTIITFIIIYYLLGYCDRM